MIAIVTGATGLLGRNVVTHLKSLNYEVIALGRNERKLKKLEQMGLTTLIFDLTQPNFDYFRDISISVIIHCAAAISGADKQTLDAVNVEGTRKLIQFAQHKKCKFVHISSVTVYGITEGNTGENYPLNPASLYGNSKMEAEQIVSSSNIDWTIIRPPYIGGPGDENFLFEMNKRIENGKLPILSRVGLIPYIDARDLARGIALIISNKSTKNEIYNIQGDAISYIEFMNIIGEVMNHKKPYGKKYNYLFLLSIATLTDMIYKIQGKNNEKGLSRYRIKTLSSNRSMNTNKIEREVKYFPKIDIKSSICDWRDSK